MKDFKGKELKEGDEVIFVFKQDGGYNVTKEQLFSLD